MAGRTPLIILGLGIAVLGGACSDDSSSDQVDSPVGNEPFSDPQGSYTMAIDPDWVAEHGFFTSDTEAWVVGEIEDESAPNVTVITQLIDPSLSLEDHLEANIAGADLFVDDFNLVNSEIVEGTSGRQLALMDYEGEASERHFHFLSIFAVAGNEAVVVTLTTTPETFDEIRASVEPYLLTLRTTS